MQKASQDGRKQTGSRGGFARLAALGLVFLLLFVAEAPGQSESGGGALSIVRDAEIETDIHIMMTPIWKVAGLDPANVHVYLVADPQINSFVANGSNIFINTGLLLRADTPDQLIGVLAHETGHIAEGHLTRAEGAMRNAGIIGIIGTVLGGAAAALGRSDQGGAAMLPGQLIAQRYFAHYRVSQEAAADAAALSYLDRTHESSRGLLQFFEKLQTEELLSGEVEIPYLRDHPLTQTRIERVRWHVDHSRWTNAPDPPQYVAMLKRIKVKLSAFLSDPSDTLAAYPETDTSMIARYARAIAYYRIPQLEKALATIDGLIREYPEDPYFAELKGQMLYENGHIREAVAPYDKAVRLDPSSLLLRIERDEVYIATQDKNLDKLAIGDLNAVLLSEPGNGQGWHLLAIAYGRNGQIGMAALSLAEQQLAAGDKKGALREAYRAKHLLPKNAASYGRALEIEREAKEL